MELLERLRAASLAQDPAFAETHNSANQARPPRPAPRSGRHYARTSPVHRPEPAPRHGVVSCVPATLRCAPAPATPRRSAARAHRRGLPTRRHVFARLDQTPQRGRHVKFVGLVLQSGNVGQQLRLRVGDELDTDLLGPPRPHQILVLLLCRPLATHEVLTDSGTWLAAATATAGRGARSCGRRGWRMPRRWGG